MAYPTSRVPVVHHCDWPASPTTAVHIRCSGKWTTPARLQLARTGGAPLPAKVFVDDEGELYAFDEHVFTCAVCRQTPLYHPPVP